MMKRIGLLLSAVLLSAAAVSVSPQLSQASEGEDPLSIVRNIYLQYGEGGELIDVPEKYFTPALLELWRDVEKATEKNVESALGFPVFNDAGQDETIKIDDVRMSLVAKKYVIARYIVLIEDENRIGTSKKYFQYNFEDTEDGWKIDNIDWGRHKQTLRQYLTEIVALRELAK